MKYHPIGTVVVLKGKERPLMIVGYQQDCDKGHYDYAGVLYPQGMIDDGHWPVFDHEEIAEVLFKGRIDPSMEEFMKRLEKISARLDFLRRIIRRFCK